MSLCDLKYLQFQFCCIDYVHQYFNFYFIAKPKKIGKKTVHKFICCFHELGTTIIPFWLNVVPFLCPWKYQKGTYNFWCCPGVWKWNIGQIWVNLDQCFLNAINQIRVILTLKRQPHKMVKHTQAIRCRRIVWVCLTLLLGWRLKG